MSDERKSELQRYHDGELSLRRAKRVQARLQSDEQARRELVELERLGDALRASAELSAEEADFSQLWSRVRQGIAEDRVERVAPSSRWLLRIGMAFASAAAAVVLLLVLWHPGRPPKNDCVVESLEVGSGVGTIFTVDDPEYADATTVIWISEAEGSNR